MYVYTMKLTSAALLFIVNTIFSSSKADIQFQNIFFFIFKHFFQSNKYYGPDLAPYPATLNRIMENKCMEGVIMLKSQQKLFQIWKKAPRRKFLEILLQVNTSQ